MTRMISLQAQAARRDKATRTTDRDQPLHLTRDDADHWRWVGTTRTTDRHFEAQRSRPEPGGCGVIGCVNPDHR